MADNYLEKRFSEVFRKPTSVNPETGFEEKSRVVRHTGRPKIKPALEAGLVDLNDYTLFGEGPNGSSYNHNSNPDMMLKLYNASSPYEIIVNEYNFAKKVYDAGIPCPKTYDFVTDGKGRFGIRFERIPGKRSFCTAMSLEPENFEKYSREFAKFCRELHSIHVDTSLFPSIKDVDLQMLDESPFFTEEEKVKIADFINRVPDSDIAHHGDLHYGNAIMTDRGNFFIDLGDFAYGHPYFDLGQVLLSSCYPYEEYIKYAFHIEPEDGVRFWHYFVKEYFGEDADIDEVTEMLRPYAGLMSLLIERNMGQKYDRYHALLSGTIL